MSEVKSIEEQVQEVTAPLKRFITRANGNNGSLFWNPRGDDEGYPTARLRVDIEVPDDVREEDSIASAVLNILEPDLVDLLRNGDMQHDDALLHTLDGAVKRGVDAPEWLGITEAVWYEEYKPKKESTEYTLYLLLALAWPTDQNT